MRQSLHTAGTVVVKRSGFSNHHGERNRFLGIVLCLMAFTVAAVVWIDAGYSAQAPSSPDGSAKASSTASADPPSKAAAVTRYKAAPGDDLDVYVAGVAELTRDYRVGPDGTLSLPLVSKEIPVQNLTLKETAEAIGDELRKEGVVSDPQVFVTVKESASADVVVSGAVRAPGVYPIYGPTPLLRVLSLAQGLADDAGNTGTITRAVPRGEALPGGSPPNSAGDATADVVKVDVEKLWKTGDPSLNINVYPGDRVSIVHAGIVYVLGAVHRAGGYVLTRSDERLTVLKALALAGDVTRTAKLKKAVVLRKEPGASPSREEIPVNLKKLLSNETPDLPLLASDILFVPESGGKRALELLTNSAPQFGLFALYRVP
jgi:polysaccharide biosynthesis/export protein